MLITRNRCFMEASRPIKVDRDKGIIHGVKVLGLISENGRKYLPQAVKEAIPLYEGIKVNIDHPENAGDSRSAQDRIGKLVNIRYVEGEGLYGDLEFLKSHPMAERICEAAERMPDAFGMSHNAQGDGEDQDGVFIVHKIVEVRHVDLVADPATTKSLNEGKKAMKETMKEPVKQATYDEMDELVYNIRGALKSVDKMMADKLGSKSKRMMSNMKSQMQSFIQQINNSASTLDESKNDGNRKDKNKMKEAKQSTYDEMSPLVYGIKDALKSIDKMLADKLGSKSKRMLSDMKSKMQGFIQQINNASDLDEAKDDDTEKDEDTMEADNAEFGSKAAEIIDGSGETSEKVAALVELVKSMYGVDEAEEPEMEYKDGEMEEAEDSASDEVDATEDDGVHVDINSHDGEDDAEMEEAEDDEDSDDVEEQDDDEDEKKPMEAKESKRYISRLCKAARVRLSESLVNDLKGLSRAAIQRQIRRIALAQKAKKPKSSIVAMTESKIPQGEDLFRWLRS